MKIMKKLNSCIKIVDRLINFITIIFFIVVLFMGSYALYDAYYVYNKAQLTDELKNLRPLDEEKEFSLKNLQAINEDICGWIRIHDTHIDYPIVIGEDNLEYLNLDYKKEFATAGTIFLDYRNNRDFEDDYSVIYGHNMEANLMFSDIKEYIRQSYFNNHLKGTLFTSKAIYNVDIFAVSYVDAYSSQVYNLGMYKNDHSELVTNNFKKYATIFKDLNIKNGDKLLSLSTCDAIGSNDRIVVLAKLTKKTEDASEIINEGNVATLKRIDDEQKRLEQEEMEGTDRKPQTIIHQKIRRIPIRTLVLIFLSIVVAIILITAIVKIVKQSKGKHSKEEPKRKK